MPLMREMADDSIHWKESSVVAVVLLVLLLHHRLFDTLEDE